MKYVRQGSRFLRHSVLVLIHTSLTCHVHYWQQTCNSQFIMLHASINDNRNTKHSFTLTSSILRYSIMTFPYNSCRCTSREYCIKHRSCSNSWSSTSTSSQLSTATAIHSHCLYLLTDTVDISTVVNSLSLSWFAKMFIRSKTSHTHKQQQCITKLLLTILILLHSFYLMISCGKLSLLVVSCWVHVLDWLKTASHCNLLTVNFSLLHSINTPVLSQYHTIHSTQF